VNIIVRLAEIINEIDEYLLSLKRARDLLAASRMTAQRSQARGRKTAISSGKRVRATRNVPPRSEMKLPVGIKTRKAKPASENLSRSRNGVSVTVQVAERIEPDPLAPERAPHQVEEALSLQKESTRVTPRRRRSARQKKTSTKIDTSPKPATASRRPVPTGWIVVSAEEAKRQREPQEHLAQARSATPLRGLTGRRAFEALFGDTSEASGNSPNLKH
jgi:hypothetical protein